MHVTSVTNHELNVLPGVYVLLHVYKVPVCGLVCGVERSFGGVADRRGLIPVICGTCSE